MKVVILPDEKTVCAKLTEIIITAVREKPDLVLGLSPSTQILPCFPGLIESCRKKEASFNRVRFFATDEFVGLGSNNPLSNAYRLWNCLFSQLDAQPENVYLLNGSASDPTIECAEYERKIEQSGGIDLQVVSLGIRGEVGRNEPSSSLGSRCRVKILVPDETTHDIRFPRHGSHPKFSMTIGITTMMAAKNVLLIAIGSGRAMVLSKALEGPITSSVTASIFQRHPKCTVILDETASTFLKRKDCYKSAL
ncbi:MAG: glucosamine-6-phosphate deaminase [Candidatus Ratteibacteria bacterium]|jgi:glucosamine-6-phosphate deaminase